MQFGGDPKIITIFIYGWADISTLF